MVLVYKLRTQNINEFNCIKSHFPMQHWNCNYLIELLTEVRNKIVMVQSRFAQHCHIRHLIHYSPRTDLDHASLQNKHVTSDSSGIWPVLHQFPLSKQILRRYQILSQIKNTLQPFENGDVSWATLVQFGLCSIFLSFSIFLS